MNHKLDTDTQVFFYEQEFYVLSNFSAFRVVWHGIDFDTSEIAYHYAKFPHRPHLQYELQRCRSSHDAFKIAEYNKDTVIFYWDDIKETLMESILLEKVKQHEYVFRKLMETGTRELVEDSWRDGYWGLGKLGNGKNRLGKLWMKIREDIRGKSWEEVKDCTDYAHVPQMQASMPPFCSPPPPQQPRG
jgi:ribA/ribD-fused uncharacterized protein